MSCNKLGLLSGFIRLLFKESLAPICFLKPVPKLILSTRRFQVWNCERTLGNKFDCIYRTVNRSYLTQLARCPLKLKVFFSFPSSLLGITFFVTSIIANETSLFVCVKDSPVSDLCSDSLSVAAFDWASLLLQSFRPVSEIKNEPQNCTM